MQRSIRTLHRWVSPIFAIGLVVSLILTGLGVPADSPLLLGLGVLVVGAILTLLVTGVLIYLNHYLPRWRRASRAR